MEDIDHSVETVHNQSKEIESRHTAEVKKELTDLKERLELTEKIAEWSYTTEVKKEVMDLKEQLELTEERMQIRSLSEKDLDEAKPRFKECMMAWIEYLTIMRQKHFKSCCVDLHEPVDCTDKKQNKVMKAVFNFGVKYLDDDVELGEEARTIILRVHMEKLRTRQLPPPSLPLCTRSL
ncbi:hypothetical protein F4778DRAFT_721335 [Xylariomycetidae sp. FL2044]|nr:hypothetical protein F4778DRAFT_721335 [Xylariomycetidae sp. FL2044]